MHQSLLQLNRRSPVWIEWAWHGSLFLVALPLFLVNLGNVALRDWDEGIVAQVARDILRSPINSLVWLYPTLQGEPYLNKPPLVHWLVALCFRLGGVNEWMARLPGAVLTALSVPLVYLIGRELWSRRTPAVLAALVYLTLLPVVRHGRLAMLDGALVCFFLGLVVCVLRSRRNLRWSLGVGIALGLIALTKGIAVILLGAIALIFIALDTPRLLTSWFFWIGICVGVAPAIAWYTAQWLHYGSAFLSESLVNQSLSRAWRIVEKNQGPVWYYLLELLKYMAPWLLFLPQGLRHTWENRNLSWAKLLLVWLCGYLLVISLMGTKLPWYLFPIYPAIALIVGYQLSQIWQIEDWLGLRQSPSQPYPIMWTIILALLAAIVAGYGIYLAGFSQNSKPDLLFILVAVSLTLLVASILIAQRNAQFVLILLWGWYLSLLMVMVSPYWLWELNETYAVKPVAAMVQRYVPAKQTVLTSYPYHRPSLNFYSDRIVTPATADTLRTTWHQQPKPYLLVDATALRILNPEAPQQLAAIDGWILITRSSPLSNEK
jgi:4-amino-4-deoxy-L-arabinose transferase-like glycosyltransferase